jgi:glycosyltransferase involved in cell wall biosynthesis
MKIDEYLAMGKPVVATKTKAMEYFQPHVYLADSLEEFIENITRAANDNDPISKSERMKFAGAHSWPAITAHVASLIHQTIKSKNRKHNINADPRIN